MISDPFPFTNHRTIAEVTLTELLRAHRKRVTARAFEMSGDAYTLQHLEMKAVEPVYAEEPEDAA